MSLPDRCSPYHKTIDKYCMSFVSCWTSNVSLTTHLDFYHSFYHSWQISLLLAPITCGVNSQHRNTKHETASDDQLLVAIVWQWLPPSFTHHWSVGVIVRIPPSMWNLSKGTPKFLLSSLIAICLTTFRLYDSKDGQWVFIRSPS